MTPPQELVTAPAGDGSALFPRERWSMVPELVTDFYRGWAVL